MVDALTLVLAAFVLLMLVGIVAQRGLLVRLSERERELTRLKDEKERIQRRLRALAPGSVEVEEGKVILQGEVLFDSGSDELTPSGHEFIARLAAPLGALLAAEPDQMVLIGGHTDDRPIHNDRFASNWELSAGRAVAVAHALAAEGVDPTKIVASGFGEYHPRRADHDEDSRRRNRRIEVLLVPIHAVSSR
jgi:flagellar motor protein MotB